MDIEMTYFSEYKTVEKLCNDMYGERGVSVYIETMELRNAPGTALVRGWTEYYKMIKHLRWLRNRIAHENENYEVTQKDIEDIKRFHSDLLSQNDPLALLHKAAKKEIERRKAAQKKKAVPVYRSANTEKRSVFNKGVAAGIAASAVIIILIILYFFFN